MLSSYDVTKSIVWWLDPYKALTSKQSGQLEQRGGQNNNFFILKYSKKMKPFSFLGKKQVQQEVTKDAEKGEPTKDEEKKEAKNQE